MYNNQEDNKDAIFNNNNQTGNDQNYFSQNQFSQGENGGNMDMPPELEEIKNLADAQENVSAPTLSALDPINLMPEDPSFDPSSKLDLYDKGIKLDNNFSQSAEGNDVEYNPDEPYLNNNSYEAESQYEATLPDSNAEYSASEPYTNNEPESNVFNSYKTESQYEDALPNEGKDVYSYEPTQMNNYNYENENEESQGYNTEGDSNASEVPNEEPPIKTNDSNKVLSFDEFMKMNAGMNELQKEETNQPVDEATNDFSLGLDDKDEKYDVIQDVNLSEPEINTITDLENINDAYSEPDTLEIMDDDSDTEDSIDAKSEQAIEKIRKIINELRNDGVNIELEEFDFEETYQLIVKVDKKEKK